MSCLKNDLFVQLPGEETAVRGALEELLKGLEPCQLDVEEAGTVELVIAEALNNIVEHAFAPPEQPGLIEIKCVQRTDGLHVRIVDDGKAMPDGRTPLGEAPATKVDLMDLPEGGFGWFLIRDLAKDVTYRREANQNILNLRLAFVRG